MPVEGDTLGLSLATLRGIGDKLYDKRKQSALEVEQAVKQLAAQGERGRLLQFIDRLIRDYVHSSQANYRKGGLLALAAAAVALADSNQNQDQRSGVDHEYLDRIVPPILGMLVDQDARVRYYACEALYNIAKVSRDDFMPFFAETFDALFRLCADPDQAVAQAHVFLDNITKDIVTVSPNFDMEGFVPQLKEALTVVNPRKRAFLISWIRALSSVPDIDVLLYLAELLEGLTDALQDKWPPEVRMSAGRCLQEFLIEIQSSKNADVGALAEIMADRVGSIDESVRSVALRWLRDFVLQSKEKLLPHYAAILGAILPALAQSNAETRQMAEATNRELQALPDELWGQLEVAAMLETVGRDLGLRDQAEPARLAALSWVNTLLIHCREEVLGKLEVLLPSLFDALDAASERVAVQALTVMATVANDPSHFRRVMQLLLDRFRLPTGSDLLERRGSLAIRRLSVLLGAQPVFTCLASILEDESDLGFWAAMVQALNLILLTAPEVRDLRALLQTAGESEEGAHLLAALYPSWCISPGAVLALCFLSQAYGHACELIGSYGWLPMSVEALVQIDRLVQLLETPTFTLLRLHLLRPVRHPCLLKAMYGLLMLLPQSNAFKTLHARLHSVPTLVLLQLEEAVGDDGPRAKVAADRPNGRAPAPAPAGTGALWQHIDFQPLLDLFQQRQLALSADDERRRASPNWGADAASKHTNGRGQHSKGQPSAGYDKHG